MTQSRDDTGIKVAIAEVMSNYATGLDTRNWPMVQDCFCEQVLIDYGPISAATGAPEVPRRAEDWLEILKANLGGFDMTHHTITNHRFVIGEDSVQCTSYLTADHMLFADPAMPLANDGEFITVSGFYTNDFVFDAGQWRIAKSMLAVTWMRGDPGLFEVAAQKVAS